jgi:hypothetical protein
VIERGRFVLGFVTLAVAVLQGAAPSVARAQTDDSGEAPPDDQAVGVAGDEYADTDPSALSDFAPTLDPYGTWVDDPMYGTVWVPSVGEVGSDFSPYVSGGHWSYDSDYVWVSDYSWGWAAFHYGRWVFIRDRGWSWIPGRLYSDAWVVWRVGDDGAFVGWAPAAPTWGWRGGIAGLLGFVASEPYVYCPPREIFAPDMGPRVVAGDRAAALTAQTRPYVVASPSVGAPRGARANLGPPPASLGIELARVPHTTAADPMLLRARHFARPSTALPLGARAPVPHVIRPQMVARPPVRAMPGRVVATPGRRK